ncbi:protein NODULATION SIGNALING PATHWAY 2-like [Trifolium pratense]|uniref:protein NODULATION SIGNALING PATHWAY 2-like n=1 Tax=Trifolium pratense TaxID=57577 RepID=UPI001E690DC0|nr:protein NODULATION SIGNALING PATHWAY 2-like [Trifolium pratense]
MNQQEILHSPWPLTYVQIDSSIFDNHHQTMVHLGHYDPYGIIMDDHVDDYGSYGMIMDDDHVDVDYVPYGIIMNDHVDDYEFNTLLSTSENSNLSEISMFTNDHVQFPIDESEILELSSLMELESFDSISCPQIVDIHEYEYREESEGSFPSQNFPCNLEEQSSNLIRDSCEMNIGTTTTITNDNFASQNFQYDSWSPTQSMKSDFSSIQQSLILPQQNMEIENQVSLPHLMEAHGEALEKGQKALAEVNLKCISQKVTPMGDSFETLAFYLSQEVTNHGEYLKGEAQKNFDSSFKALYQGNLVGKVAHFAAISAILEAAMLEDCDEIHIIDFCIGNGVQWPSLLESASRINKRLKLTSIKSSHDENSECVWNFEDTKRELCEYAKSCGLNLMVEEKGLEELVSEIKIMNKRGARKVFLAFNLMIGLPHMGMVRNRRKNALEFLKVAEDLIKNCGSKGMITFGDGDVFEKLKNSLNFKSFFEGNLVHYKALLESIESQFSEKFSKARIACEVLFVAPCISSCDWLQTWEEMKSDGDFQAEISLESGCLSKNVLMEVKEVLRGCESSYQARIEGGNENELVVEWKGTQLLRFSIWKN